MKNQFVLAILAAITLNSTSLFAAAESDGIAKADADTLHLAIHRSRTLDNASQIKLGIDEKNFDDEARALAKQLSPCKVTSNFDDQSHKSTHSLSGDACPLNTASAYISNGYMFQNSSTQNETQTTVTDQAFAMAMGFSQMHLAVSTKTEVSAGGDLHSDETHTIKLTTPAGVEGNIGYVASIDGTVVHNGDSLEVTYKTNDIHGTIRVGVRDYQFSLSMSQDNNGAIVNCTVNSAPADCQQLSYLMDGAW